MRLATWRFVSSMMFTSIGLALTPVASADDWMCQTDCGEVASFNYPCPTLRNPRRTCEGRDPVTYASCTAAKEASCIFWDDFINGEIKTILSSRYNGAEYKRATEGDREQSYLRECEEAALLTITTIAAAKGGPYAGLAGGAVGIFLSHRICEQSESW